MFLYDPKQRQPSVKGFFGLRQELDRSRVPGFPQANGRDFVLWLSIALSASRQATNNQLIITLGDPDLIGGRRMYYDQVGGGGAQLAGGRI